MDSRIAKSIRCLSCLGLSLGMLTILAGCNTTPRTTKYYEVSGKVLFQGKPLPGGRVNFVAVNGAFASSANIEENGSYKISAPVGEVKIAVDNIMLKQTAKSSPPKTMKHLKPPGSEQKERPITGKYIQIPRQYADAANSGLTYTVKPEAQNHDIELSDNPPPPPSAFPGAS